MHVDAHADDILTFVKKRKRLQSFVRLEVCSVGGTVRAVQGFFTPETQERKQVVRYHRVEQIVEESPSPSQEYSDDRKAECRFILWSLLLRRPDLNRERDH